MQKNKLIKCILFIILLIVDIKICIANHEDYYSRDTNFEETQVIELLNSSGMNNQGCLIVSGDIKNISEYNVTQVKIVVISYNDAYDEIAKSTDICEKVLRPNDTYHFSVSCLKKDGSSYNIQIIPTIEEKSKNLFDVLFN